MTDLTPEEAHVVLARLDRTSAVTFGEGMALAAAVEKLRAIVGGCSRDGARVTPSNLRRFTVTESREVMEVTADNLDEVAAWCGGTVHWSQHLEGVGMVLVRSFGQERAVRPGDVLIRLGERAFWPMPREEFEQDHSEWVEECSRCNWPRGEPEPVRCPQCGR